MFNAIQFNLNVLLMNEHKIITFILQNLCLFLCSQCWRTKKQNGSGCRASSSQHLFVFYTETEITGVFTPALRLHYLPLTFMVILNHFTDLNKKAADNCRIQSTFSTDQLKKLARGKTEECKIYSGGTEPTLCSDQQFGCHCSVWKTHVTLRITQAVH